MGGIFDSPDPPPAPDYSGVANASEKSAELSFQLGQDQLAWAKEQYGKDSEITKKVVDSALDTMDINRENAIKDRERYEQKYQPLEDDYNGKAKNWASAERKASEMGAAQATVAQNFEAQRQAAMQNLEGFGVDPTSTRYAALDLSTRTQQAAASAAAGNSAVQNLDREQMGLEANAVNIGRGYPGQVAAQFQTGVQAGQSAQGSQLGQTASGANTMGTAAQWQGVGNQALSAWTGALNGQANANYQSFMAGQSADPTSQILGLAGGLGAAAMMKYEDGGPVETPGGAIPEEASPSHGQAVDDVDAKVTVGEFVMPLDVVRWKGEEFFQKVITQSRKDRETKAPAQGRAVTAIPAAEPTFVSRPGQRQAYAAGGAVRGAIDDGESEEGERERSELAATNRSLEAQSRAPVTSGGNVYTPPPQQSSSGGGGMSPPTGLIQMGMNKFGGGSGAGSAPATAPEAGAAGGEAAEGSAGSSGGMMGSLGPIAGIAAAVGVSKHIEQAQGNSSTGRVLGSLNAPSFEQIKADPKIGVTTAVGIPFVNGFIRNDKAAEAKPEWEKLL